MAEIKPRKIRPPRRRADLPHPSLPAHHSKNQLQPLFAARVEPDVMKRINRWIKNNKLTKRQATEFAFELAMEMYPGGPKGPKARVRAPKLKITP